MGYGVLHDALAFDEKVYIGRDDFCMYVMFIDFVDALISFLSVHHGGAPGCLVTYIHWYLFCLGGEGSDA